MFKRNTNGLSGSLGGLGGGGNKFKRPLGGGGGLGGLGKLGTSKINLAKKEPPKEPTPEKNQVSTSSSSHQEDNREDEEMLEKKEEVIKVKTSLYSKPKRLQMALPKKQVVGTFANLEVHFKGNWKMMTCDRRWSTQDILRNICQ